MAKRIATRRRASARRLAAAAVMHTVVAEARPLLAEHKALVRAYHGTRRRAHDAAVDEQASLLLLAAEAAMDQQHAAARAVLLRVVGEAGARGEKAGRLAPRVGRAVDGFARLRLRTQGTIDAAWARIVKSRAFLERTAP